MPIIKLDNTTISEADGSATLIFTLSEASAQTVSFSYSAAAGTTSSYNDYTAFSGTLSFAPGQTSISTKVTVTNDSALETTEVMFVVMSAPKNAELERTSAALTIIDNDAVAGTPSISVSNTVVDESYGLANFIVTLDKPATVDVTVNYGTQNGTALAGSDFTAQSGTLVFRAGETAKTISVPILNDSVAEAAETFNLVLSQASSGNLAQSVGTARIAISEFAALDLPQIHVADTTISEHDGFADIVFSLNAPSTKTISVPYSAGAGTSSSYNDYASFSGTLTFAAGETSKTLRVAIFDDSSAETSEVMYVNLGAPVNATLDRQSAAITIADDDASPGVPAVSVANLVADEKAGVVHFVLTLDKPSTGDVSLNYATKDVSATAGTDYTALSGSLTFRAGETSKTVSVLLSDDSVAEAQESLQLVLSNISGGTLAQSTGIAIIPANDAANADLPMIRLENTVVSEHAGYADIVFTLSAPSTRTVSCDYSAGAGTSSSYNDYSTFSGTVAFAAGETSKTVRVAIYNDSSLETQECMFVNLGTAVNAKLERTSAALLVVDNDAAAGVPSISVSNTVVDEKAGVAHFTVSLDKPSTTAITVPYATSNGTALAGQDYAAQVGNLVFRPGDTAQTIDILLRDSGAAQPNTMFNLELGTPTGGANLADAVGHARIEAHGAAAIALPMINIAPSTTLSEADGYVDVVLSLSAPSSQVVSVDYDAGAGTSSSYNDYASFSGTITFTPGETSKTMRVAVYNDSTAETIETLYTNFAKPVNAVLERTSMALTIHDNDASAGVPAVCVSDSVVDEKRGHAEFVVTLDKPSTSDVSVAYTTRDGSAIAGTDYVPQSGSVVFRAGETSKTISILVNDDGVVETAERFSLELATPINGTLTDGVGTVQIAANNNFGASQPQIQVADTIVSEADGYADVLFTLSSASTQNISVNYAYGNGTASSYNDLATFSGTLNFAAGETSKTVRIAIYNDSSVESNETFLVVLDKAVNASLERTSATVTIANDDSGGRFMHYGMGNDVYDISSSADVVYELQNQGTDLVRFTMADYVAPDNVENLQGNAQNNQLTGNLLNNCLKGGAGNDSLNGGAGVDTAQYSGNRANFTISKTSTGFTVTDKTNAEGVDTLVNVERIKFADATLALDSSGVGGQAYRVYQAAFNRVPDAGGLGYWINALDNGASLLDVANGFVGSNEFKAMYGSNPTNAEIVSKFYENVLHRQGEIGGYNYWLGVLDNNYATRAQVLASFSESTENQDALISVIGTGFAYVPYG